MWKHHPDLCAINMNNCNYSGYNLWPHVPYLDEWLAYRPIRSSLSRNTLQYVNYVMVSGTCACPVSILPRCFPERQQSLAIAPRYLWIIHTTIGITTSWLLQTSPTQRRLLSSKYNLKYYCQHTRMQAPVCEQYNTGAICMSQHVVGTFFCG